MDIDIAFIVQSRCSIIVSRPPYSFFSFFSLLSPPLLSPFLNYSRDSIGALIGGGCIGDCEDVETVALDSFNLDSR
jgi:hypothetical protein